MYFDWQKVISLTITTGFLLCLLINPCAAQIKRPAAKNDSSEKLLAEATEAVSSEDLNRAKSLIQKVLAASPRDAAAHTIAGIIADRENDLTAAEKHFATAARLQPKSAEMLNNY